MFVTACQLITNIEATLYLAKYEVVLHVVKKIPCGLWTHNRFRNIPPIIPIVIQTSAVNTLLPCFFKIYFNVIVPFTPRFSQEVFPQDVFGCILLNLPTCEQLSA